eukprot:1466797-Prymnesium_polylepis.1
MRATRAAASRQAKGSDWVNQLKLANESDSTILDKLRGDPRVTCAGRCPTRRRAQSAQSACPQSACP